MKNLSLTSRIRAPYGGKYVWTDPMIPNGAPVVGTTFDMLLDRARAARYANSIPVGLEFEKEVERDICRSYPNECNGWDPTIPKPRSLTMDDVLRGSKVMLAFKMTGSPLVSQTEANERARICSENNCGQNIGFQKRCGHCMDVEKLVASVIGHSSTPYDARLNSCSVCGCSLKAAVWVPLDIQAKGVTEEQRQQFQRLAQSMQENGHTPCWKAAI